MTQIDRAERLINLVALLRASPRAVTLEEIVSRVPGYPERKESYRRQFERDKDELRGIGVPIVIERVARDAYDEVDGAPSVVDGYRIPREEYELPDLGLTDAERTALNVAFGAVRMAGGPGRETMWKLGGGAGQPAAAPASALAAIPALEALGPLHHATRSRATVRFVYRQRDRAVDPFGLVFRRGHWYLIGRDHDADAPRAYRVDRMEGDIAVGDPAAFAPYPGDPGELLADDPLRFADDEPVVAEVAVDAPFVEEARRLFTASTERPTADGAVFTLTVTNREAFRGTVLELLDGAEILTPPELRNEIMRWLHAVIADAPEATP